MYEMYPDWGPARHAPESPWSNEALQAAMQQRDGLRDASDDRPDDN